MKWYWYIIIILEIMVFSIMANNQVQESIECEKKGGAYVRGAVHMECVRKL